MQYVPKSLPSHQGPHSFMTYLPSGLCIVLNLEGHLNKNR